MSQLAPLRPEDGPAFPAQTAPKETASSQAPPQLAPQTAPQSGARGELPATPDLVSEATPFEAAEQEPSLPRRLAFWGGGGVVFLAAAVAALAPQVVGAAGLILLLGLAGAAGLLLYAAASGLPTPISFRPTPARVAPPRMQDAAAAFESLPDPALILDRDGAPRMANAAFRRLSQDAGVMGESARPPGFDRVLGAHPAIAAAVFRLARAARRGEARRETLPAAPFGLERMPRRFELEATPIAAGRSLWRAHELPLKAPAAAEVEGAALDVLLDEAPIGFFAADPEGRVVYANETLREWIGPTADRPDLRLGHFIAGDPLRVIGRPRNASQTPVRSEITLRARDGVAAPALVVSTWPRELEPGAEAYSRSIVYARAGGAAPVGVAQAVAATSAATPSSTMDSMFANAPFGVARLDRASPADAGVADANPVLLHMTHGAAGPGARFADLFEIEADDHRARFDRGEADASAPIEVQLKRPGEGEPLFAQLYFAPDGAGRLTAYIVDVTEQKLLEKQLFHSQKMQAIGTLAGGVAHDMRNMLQAIVGSTYELMRRHPLGDPSYPFLLELDQHVARGKALLRQLLAFARQETVKPEVIDVPAFISDTSVWLRPLVGEKVRVETVLGRDTPHVKMGRPQLESVLMNLAANARDAMKTQSGGALEITTRKATHEELASVRDDDVAEGDYAAIDVRDTGCGMDKATLEHVFDPFFTTKEQGQGTGLGLATVFGVVRQAGGHILVDSKEGEGTAFHIYLPACSQDDINAAQAAHERSAALAAVAAAEEETTDLSGSGRILLIEDNDAVRAFTARMLEAQGYEVLQAADGSEALDIVKEYPGELELVISDVMMPEMDGPTFLKTAREQLGDAPVIFISGYAESEFSDLLGEEQHVHFLAKPFKLDELARRVKALLAVKAE